VIDLGGCIKMSGLLNFGLMAIIYGFYFFPKWKTNKYNLILKTLFYIYICSVLWLTILPLPLGYGIHLVHYAGYQYGNIYPFHDYLLGRSGAMRDIILNIIMLMPFGFLYPIIKQKKLLHTVAAAFLFSLAIELFQLMVTVLITNYRSFDVTDLITNTLGGLIGYLIYLLLKSFFVKKIK